MQKQVIESMAIGLARRTFVPLNDVKQKLRVTHNEVAKVFFCLGSPIFHLQQRIWILQRLDQGLVKLDTLQLFRFALSGKQQ